MVSMEIKFVPEKSIFNSCGWKTQKYFIYLCS